MILQALTEYYRALSEQGKIDRPGWSRSGVSYALCINDRGELERAITVKTEQLRGKKTALGPQAMSLPAPVKRTVSIASNFLWDNSSYLLGVDNKGKPQRSLECFHACRDLHHQLLDGVDSPAAKALLAFFDRWEPEKAAEHPALQESWEELISSANLVFRYNGVYVHADPLIQQAWQSHYDSDGDGPQMVCLVTGQKGPAQAIHPAIKGLVGAQPGGAALVSFNAPAFCSYGREQNLNAPVGKSAAFAYTAALNYLLADWEHTFRVGDTTVLFWAKSAQSAFQDFFSACSFGSASPYDAGELAGMLESLLKGDPVKYDETLLDPNMDFYILGLSPNAARISVRFFLHNTFGSFLENTRRHQNRLKLVRPANDSFESIPPWKLLEATANQNSRDKSPSPILAGEVLRAILTDTRYPAALYNNAMLRITAERKIGRVRAAILKAYLLKNFPDHTTLKEEISLPIVYENEGPAFLLGCLLALLEKIQQEAIEGINQTLADKYLSSAASTPSLVFDTLLEKSKHHIGKIGGKNRRREDLQNLLRVYHEKSPGGFPKGLSHVEKGEFMIGYYVKNAELWAKKAKSEEENENV